MRILCTINLSLLAAALPVHGTNSVWASSSNTWLSSCWIRAIATNTWPCARYRLCVRARATDTWLGDSAAKIWLYVCAILVGSGIRIHSTQLWLNICARSSIDITVPILRKRRLYDQANEGSNKARHV